MLIKPTRHAVKTAVRGQRWGMSTRWRRLAAGRSRRRIEVQPSCGAVGGGELGAELVPVAPVGGEAGAAQGAAAAALAFEGGLGGDVEQEQVAGAAAAAGQADQEPAAPAAGAGVVDDQAGGPGQGDQDPQVVLGVDQRPPQPVGDPAEPALEPGPDRLRVEDQRPGGVDARQQGGLAGAGDPGHHQQGGPGQAEDRRARRDVAFGRVELHHVGDDSGLRRKAGVKGARCGVAGTALQGGGGVADRVARGRVRRRVGTGPGRLLDHPPGPHDRHRGHRHDPARYHGRADDRGDPDHHGPGPGDHRADGAGRGAADLPAPDHPARPGLAGRRRRRPRRGRDQPGLPAQRRPGRLPGFLLLGPSQIAIADELRPLRPGPGLAPGQRGGEAAARTATGWPR